VPKIKVGQHLPDFLDVDTMLSFLDSLRRSDLAGSPQPTDDGDFICYRHAHLRIAGLSLHDINRGEQIILVHGKGNKQRYVLTWIPSSPCLTPI
jgi:site-specific recombinase XerC